MKNIRIFYLKIFIFLVVKNTVYLNRHGLVMLDDKMGIRIRLSSSMELSHTTTRMTIDIVLITTTLIDMEN